MLQYLHGSYATASSLDNRMRTVRTECMRSVKWFCNKQGVIVPTGHCDIEFNSLRSNTFTGKNRTARPTNRGICNDCKYLRTYCSVHTLMACICPLKMKMNTFPWLCNNCLRQIMMMAWSNMNWNEPATSTKTVSLGLSPTIHREANILL